MNSLKQQSTEESGEKVEYEFNIEGMTCVACSGSIENGMKIAFKDRGLLLDQQQEGKYQVNVMLLVNKMRMYFDKAKAEECSVTPEVIVDEVEDLGFGAELINTVVHKKVDPLQKQKKKGLKVDPDEVANLEPVIKTCNLVIQNFETAEQYKKLEQSLQDIQQKHSAIQSFAANILTSSTKFTYDQNQCRPLDIIEWLDEEGFVAKLMIKSDDTDIRKISQKEVAKYKQRVYTCILLYLPLLFCIWGIPFIPGLDKFMLALNLWRGNTFYVLLCLIFASIIQFYLGQQFYSSAWKSVKHKSANMDVLVVLGTTAAYGYGVILIIFGFPDNVVHYRTIAAQHYYQLLIHNHVHNFETSSVLILIVLVGKYIESYSKMKTVGQLSQLASLKVNHANLVKETDRSKLELTSAFREIQVELLEIGDFVIVQAGSAVPTDGIVVFGQACTNESMLTGESKPQSKAPGKRVFGGSILTQGTIIFEVEKIAEDATFNQIMKMVENAQNSKAPIQGVADRISAYFVPVIVSLALIDWFIWLIIVYTSTKFQEGGKHNNRFQFAFDFGISTLVIACPCALGLATPTAVMVGTGLAASKGVLIKGGDIFEKIIKINTIVFDKTGTLTSGKPHVKDVISCHDKFKIQKAISNNKRLLGLLYLAEVNSEHPVAAAIRDDVSQNINTDSLSANKVIDFNNIDGEGIKVQIEEKGNSSSNPSTILCGNMKLMRNNGVFPSNSSEDENSEYAELVKNITLLEQQGRTVIILAVGTIPQLIVSLEEEHLAKKEAEWVVNYLSERMGMQVCMITGDNKHTAIKVAKHLGIALENTHAEAYPEQKKAIVEHYQSQGNKVMFIGDGINDSPVLAQADIGCAINSASDITVSAAGIVLIKDDLIDVLRAILISKKTFQRIKINFAFAFLYNVILIPVAMGVFYPIRGFKLDPMFAAIAMALSSISVVSSSLFLKLYRPDGHIRDMTGKRYFSYNQVYGKVEDVGESGFPLVQDEAILTSKVGNQESAIQLLNDKLLDDPVDIEEQEKSMIEFKAQIN